MTSIAKRREKFSDLKTLFAAQRGQFAAVAAKHMDPERLTRVALSACSRNPKLLECTPESLLASIMDAAKLGLEPTGAIGGAYLVPYRNKGVYEAQLMTDYRGEMALARRSGQISTISAHVVYANDMFDLEYGDNERLTHRPALEGEPGKPRFVYAIAHLKDGGIQRAVLTMAEVDHYRKKSKAATSGPWKTDWEAMAKKTAIRRLCNYLPRSVEYSSWVQKEEDPEPIQLEVVDIEDAPDVNAGDELAKQLEMSE